MKEQIETIDNSIHDIERIKKNDWYKSYSVSANYTFNDNDKIKTLFVTTGASDITITLPTSADNLDRVIEVVKVDSGAGSVIVDGEGAETINGQTTQTLWSQFESLTIKSKVNWYILNWIPAVEWEYGRLTSNTNVNAAWVVIDTLKTLSKDGYYEISANVTFYNNQNTGASVNYIGLAVAVNGTRRGANYHELLNNAAGGEYCHISVLNAGNFSKNDVITLHALASGATIVQTTAGADYRSHWIIKRFPNARTL